MVERTAAPTVLAGAPGDLAKEPDPEKSLVREAITRVKAALAEDELTLPLREGRPDEERIIACD